MSPDDVVAIGRQTVEIILLLSAPMLLSSLLVGVVISLVQTVTQIQEQTLTFVPKLVTMVVIFVLTLPWALDVLMRFTADLYLSFDRFVQ